MDVTGKQFAILLGLALVLTGCASQQETTLQSTGLADFSGSWELDYELSENPSDKLRFLYEVTRSQIQQQMAVQRDQVRSGRMPSTPVSAATINSLQGVVNLGRLTEMISRPTVLTIEQSPENIIVQREAEFALTCDFVNGEQSKSMLGREACGWQDNQLIFEVSLPEGLLVQHRLVLSGNGKRLNVATTVGSTAINQLFTLNRVYMPFELGKGMYECEYSLAKKKTCRLGTSN
jgi:hypothetical protein